MKKTPILILAFNRPDMVRKLLKKVQEWQPDSLWVVVDGPRNESEADLVDQVKLCFDEIDWCSDMHTNYASENMGCHRRVSSGLDWFFLHNSQGIILEDDCIPLISFFSYCEELLKRYKNEEKITAIEGVHRLDRRLDLNESYFFSSYYTFHGWATWSRAWKKYTDDVSDADVIIRQKFTTLRSRLYWNWQLRRVAKGKLSSWGYRWMLSNWRTDSVSIVPITPLVENIGYGENSTHTKGSSYYLMPAENLTFPLTHPNEIETNVLLDKRLEDCCYSRSLYQRILWFLRRILNLNF